MTLNIAVFWQVIPSTLIDSYQCLGPFFEKEETPEPFNESIFLRNVGKYMQHKRGQ
jgi:hypothetical protein